MTTPAIRIIGRNTAFLLGTSVINLGSRLVWIIVAARVLGPELYALLAYSATWQLAFLPLALFGVGPALSYLIGPDRSRAPEYAGHVLAIRLITIVIAVVACIALSRVFTPDPRAPLLIAILSIALAARALTTYTQTLFTAFEINQYTLRQEVLFGLFDLGIALTILLSGGSLVLLVSARAVIAWLQTFWALSIAHRRVLPLRVEWRPSAWGPLLRLALPALMITFAADWLFNGSLVLFRNLTSDGVLFGQYALAMQALAILVIAPVALSRAAFPALRRAVARKDGKEVFFASLIQRIAPIIGTAAGLTGIVLGEPVAAWVLGEPYRMAGELAGWTLWCLIPMSAAVGYPEILIARGRFYTVVFLNLVSAAAMTGLTLIWVPAFGVTGAIAAAFIGFCLTPLGALAIACRERLADPGRDLGRPFAAAALAVIAYGVLQTVAPWLGLLAGLLTLGLASAVLRIISAADFVAFRGQS